MVAGKVVERPAERRSMDKATVAACIERVKASSAGEAVNGGMQGAIDRAVASLEGLLKG